MPLPFCEAMTFPLLLLLLTGGPFEEEERAKTAFLQQAELERRVYAYWDSLKKQDKVSALQYVQTKSHNRFIQRRDPFFRSWDPISINKRTETKVLVTVRIDRMMAPSQTFYEMLVKEIWVLGEEGWQVRLPELTSKSVAELYAGTRKEKPKKLSGDIRLLPDPLKIHFLNKARLGSVFVLNGLKDPVQVTSVELDKERFKLEAKADKVASGEKGEIRIRYVGDEEKKDLTAELRISIRKDVQGDEKEEAFTVPVVYNYLSPGARALFGLNEATAKALKRGDALSPAIQLSDGAKSVPKSLPIVPPPPKNAAPISNQTE